MKLNNLVTAGVVAVAAKDSLGHDSMRQVSTPVTNQVNAVLSSNLSGVITYSTPVLVTASAPGGAVVVTHDLGVVPNVFHVEPLFDCRVWADQNDRIAWTTNTLVFHCSGDGNLIVMAGSR